MQSLNHRANMADLDGGWGECCEKAELQRKTEAVMCKNFAKRLTNGSVSPFYGPKRKADAFQAMPVESENFPSPVPLENKCSCGKKPITGLVLNTGSSDFPHVVLSGRDAPLCLFPRSLYFVESNTLLSKAQKLRRSTKLPDGCWIQFYASADNIILQYDRVQDLMVTNIGRSGSGNRTYIKDLGVISPETPRRCWSQFFGVIPADVNMTSMAFPNVVLEFYVGLEAFVIDPPSHDARSNAPPLVKVVYELAEIINPVLNNEYIRHLYAVPWNRSERRGIVVPCPDDELNCYKIPKIARPILPQLTPQFAENVLLHMFDEKRIVWTEYPMYRVVLGHITANYANRITGEGCVFEGDLFYCEFNRVHVCGWYRVPKPERGIMPIAARPVITSAGDSYHEYRVELSHSFYAGFFVDVAELRNCLIEDPRHLLLRAVIGGARKTYPAWIRLNTSVDRIARFSVSSMQDEFYTNDELFTILPRVNGVGVLVDVATGSVFCAEFPQLLIFLMLPDRTQLQLGEYFNFSAIFFPARDIFVVTSSSPLKHKFPLKSQQIAGGFMFEETLHCRDVRGCLNVYLGETFGLVEDPNKFILNNSIAEDAAKLPAEIRVYVRENTDYHNRQTAFFVYVLSMTSAVDKRDFETDVQASLPPTSAWWRPLSAIGKREYGDEIECKCREIDNLFRQLRAEVQQFCKI